MTTSSEIIAAELAEAQTDVATLARLQSAEARVKALTAAYDKAVAAEERTAERAAKQAQAERFAGLSDICITAEGKETNILRTVWAITYKGPHYDMMTGETVTAEHMRRGLGNLDEHVLEFLIERHPDRIPAEIMAFAPGDPYAALDAYFIACRRGYANGPLAAE